MTDWTPNSWRAFPAEQQPVLRAPGDQLVVGAEVEQPTPVDDRDPVGQRQSRPAVRDQDRGLLSLARAQVLEDERLGLGVDRR